jgi:hypothetical protein
VISFGKNDAGNGVIDHETVSSFEKISRAGDDLVIIGIRFDVIIFIYRNAVNIEIRKITVQPARSPESPGNTPGRFEKFDIYGFFIEDASLL